MSAPEVYRSGAKKGLPKLCECGGKMEYAFGLGMVFCSCASCTPVMVIMPTAGAPVPEEGA